MRVREVLNSQPPLSMPRALAAFAGRLDRTPAPFPLCPSWAAWAPEFGEASLVSSMSCAFKETVNVFRWPRQLV
jgi:hypothetical protein